MNTKYSQHEMYYRIIHACLVAYVLDERKDMKAFQKRFEQYPDNWTRALACGFCRMGHSHLGMVRTEATDGVAIFSEGQPLITFDCPKPPDFYSLNAESFVKMLFPESVKVIKAAKKMKLNAIGKGFDAVIKFDHNPEALSLDEMKDMAVGLGKLILFYPPFFDESERDGVLQGLSYSVTEDLFGKWPKQPKKRK